MLSQGQYSTASCQSLISLLLIMTIVLKHRIQYNTEYISEAQEPLLTQESTIMIVITVLYYLHDKPIDLLHCLLCQFHTNFPESFSYLVIRGLRVVCFLYLTVSQVLPCHSLHLLTDSTVDGCLGSLFGSF